MAVISSGTAGYFKPVAAPTTAPVAVESTQAVPPVSRSYVSSTSYFGAAAVGGRFNPTGKINGSLSSGKESPLALALRGKYIPLSPAGARLLAAGNARGAGRAGSLRPSASGGFAAAAAAANTGADDVSTAGSGDDSRAVSAVVRVFGGGADANGEGDAHEAPLSYATNPFA